MAARRLIQLSDDEKRELIRNVETRDRRGPLRPVAPCAAAQIRFWGGWSHRSRRRRAAINAIRTVRPPHN
jgi:hypothetical protein